MFGRIWRIIIRAGEQPMASEDCTYILDLMAMTALRMTLDELIPPEMPMTMMIWNMPLPIIDITVINTRNDGIDIQTSTNLCQNRSTLPPAKPEIIPRTVEIPVDNAVAHRPMIIETRAP